MSNSFRQPHYRLNLGMVTREALATLAMRNTRELPKRSGGQSRL